MRCDESISNCSTDRLEIVHTRLQKYKKGHGVQFSKKKYSHEG